MKDQIFDKWLCKPKEASKAPLRQPLILAGGSRDAGPIRSNNTAIMDIDHSTIARFLEQGTFDRIHIGNEDC